jgi:hypothetical protein
MRRLSEAISEMRRRRHVSKVRAGDIPRTWLPRYYLYRYGHQFAYVLLGVGCFLALALLVHVVDKQNDTDRALARLIQNIQIDRRTSTSQICKSNNRLVFRLRGLIVDGARGSKPFEKLFRAYGLPGYAARVRKSKRQAASLKVVPCAVLIERIRKLTPPPPTIP